MMACCARWSPLPVVLGLLASATVAAAGSFSFVQEGDEDRVTHPTGYTGAGVALSISVCIDPSSIKSRQIGTHYDTCGDVSSEPG